MFTGGSSRQLDLRYVFSSSSYLHSLLFFFFSDNTLTDVMGGFFVK